MPKAARTTPIEFKGLADWIEVFKAGSHVDSKGRECSFTEADLDQMVANVALGKPPAVLGHPQHDDPAYAWGELKREGGSLFAKFDDINPQFAAGVESGAYRNRSVSILKDKQHGWRVRHIGWLGAAPPAIDGLKPVQFSAEDDTDQHEFGGDGDYTASWALGDVATMLRGLREYVIGRDGLETADRVLPTWQIDSVANAATRIREQAAAEPAPAFTAPPNGDPNMSGFTQADLDRARQEGEAAARAAQEAEFTATKQRADQAEATLRAERIKGQVDGLVASGHVTPAEAVGMVEFLSSVDSGAEFEFTAADRSQAKKTPSQWVLDFVRGRKALKLGAREGQGADDTGGIDMTDARAIAGAAQEYQAAEAEKGNVISIAQAVSHVTTKRTAG